MKTGYSFGSLVSFTEALDKAAVKITGDQTIAGVKTFSSNPISSAAQGTGGSYLTRKDYVDGALALKAPLASPVFTGNPTAPTAALFDGDTTIATTAFVQRALGNHQSYVWTGDATIQPAWAGCFIWYAGAGTLYLPNNVNVPVGATFEIMCTGNGAITAQSGELITLPNGTQIDSITPLVGDIVKFVRLDTSWAYSGSNYCATAATGDRSTRPASTQFVRNYLESSPQLAGNVHVEGNVNITGEYQTTNAVSYRIAYGDYGSFWHFDSQHAYLMFTNKGDKWGSYSGLRPFFANCETGRVTMANGVSVAGGLVVDDGLAVTGGVIFNQNLSTKQYNIVDGLWAIANWNMHIANNYSCGGLYDSSFGVVGREECFLPILSGSAATDGEDYTTRVKFGFYSSSSQGGWLRKTAGIWVGSGESADHPHYLYKFNVYGGFTTGAVVADTTITAGTSINAGDTISAPHLVSTAVDQSGLRFTGGPYGVMCFNGSDDNFYFLLTNMNDQLGGFNSLRPFTINKRTGRALHNHGLSVSGDIDTNVITTSDNINAGGNITSAGSVIAKSSYNNIPMGVTSYTRGGLSCSLGVSVDAKPFMILMCPQYSSTALNKSGMSGRVTLSRGSTASGLVEKFVDFSIVSGYTTNLLEIYHQNAGAKIVTTTYNSVAYYALHFNAMSAVDVLFDGIRYDQDFVPILIQDASGYATSTISAGELYARLLYPILTSPSLVGAPTAPTPASSSNGTAIATTAFVKNQISPVMPVGTVIYSAASTAPSGFIICDGRALNRTSYPALFAVIGTTYGAGDGSTTFNLPDLRGEFIRGWDGGRGADAGRGFGSWQSDAFQGHKHLPSSPVGYGGGWGDQNRNIGNGITETPGTVDGGYGTPRISTETRPRNVALLPCIKY